MKSGEIFQIPDNEIYQSPFSKDENLRKDIIKATEVQEYPFLYLEDEMIYYGIFCDKKGNCCLFGPMARKIWIMMQWRLTGMPIRFGQSMKAL